MRLQGFFARFRQVEKLSGKLCLPSISCAIRVVRFTGLKGYRLFRVYQMDIHPFLPTLANIHGFETELCGYVQSRRHTTSVIDAEQRPAAQDLQQGMSMAWISILFALMACGAQFCNDSSSTRQEQSALYGE